MYLPELVAEFCRLGSLGGRESIFMNSEVSGKFKKTKFQIRPKLLLELLQSGMKHATRRTLIVAKLFERHNRTAGSCLR